MSSLEKFNTTLEEFDKEVGRLKSATAVYQKLEGLVNSYNDIISIFNKNTQLLQNINKSQLIQQQEINSTFESLNSQQQQLKKELFNLLEERIDFLHKQNKSFYIDLEQTVKIKLDDNKAEIKRLIESEREKIKEIIETETNKQTAILQARQKNLKITIWIIGAFIIILNLLSIFKLWF